MSQTVVVAGSLNVNLAMQDALSGDQSGQVKSVIQVAQRFAAAASLPDIMQASGFLYGEPVCAAGDWLLAHLTDPFQAMGDAIYPAAFSPAGLKVKAIAVENLDTANSITLTRGASNGLPIFLAAGDGSAPIPPGGVFIATFPVGTVAVTTGTNDKLTIAVSAGSPQARVLVVYGT